MRSRTERSRRSWSTSGSDGARGDGAGTGRGATARLAGRGAGAQRDQHDREVSEVHRSLVLLGLWGWSLGCGPPAPRAAAPARVRPGIEVLLSDSVNLVRGRRVGLVTNQSGVDSRGVSDVARSAECRCRSRRAVQSGARFPRRRRSGCGGGLLHRFGNRPTNLQSLRPEFRPLRRDAPRHRRDAGRSAGCRGAVLHVSLHDRRGDEGGGAIAAYRSWCSTGPTRSAGRCRGTCSIAPRRRRWDIWRCRCGTA